MAAPEAADGVSTSPLQSPALDRLLTADQTILLNTVDKLRNHGVSKYIELPQIIVCGDQSSGKSSVLEAISRISFPRGEGICTTFPTELALRRSSKRVVKVQLKPWVSRPEAERELLASYQPQAGKLEDFEPLVKEAKEHLRKHAGKDRKADSFFEDTLHVEITDPEWPPLSLVDLPGLISSPNPRQTQEDVTTVNDLVAKYMENPKSIILAVISASYELPVQKVFSLIKKYDPQGKRTICVITKPDIATPGPSGLPQFVSYAQNKLGGYNFELGWHVVKNRQHDSQSRTADERDNDEKEFFAHAAWAGSLHRDQLGINRLRERLSKLLERHTRAEMPGVLKQIQDTLAESRDELSRLGPARSTIEAQRLHLTSISQRFENLVRQAVNGNYDDSSFFLPDLPENDPRKLRAALQNLNEDFAKTMHACGHEYQIVRSWNAEDTTKALSSSIFQPFVKCPVVLLRSAYIQKIKALSRKNRGKELIGSPNLRLVRDLFLEQSRPWRVLAKQHLEIVQGSVAGHLSQVAKYVADTETATAIHRQVIFDAIEKRQIRTMEKLEELLRPHEKGHPITYDLTYIENSRNLVKDDVKARLEEFQHANESNKQKNGWPTPAPQGLQIDQVMSALKLDADEIEEVECTETLNCMQAYYEGALRTFIDNVAVLAIEGCLVDGLEDIFNAMEVIKMDDQTLRAIGGESDQAQAERQELEQKVTALQDAHRECLRAGATLSQPPAAKTPVQQSMKFALPREETKTSASFGPSTQALGSSSTSQRPVSNGKTNTGLFSGSGDFGRSSLNASATATPPKGLGLFGAASTEASTTKDSPSKPTGVFGAATTPSQPPSLFGATTPSKSPSLFGATSPSGTSGLFGAATPGGSTKDGVSKSSSIFVDSGDPTRAKKNGNGSSSSGLSGPQPLGFPSAYKSNGFAPPSLSVDWRSLSLTALKRRRFQTSDSEVMQYLPIYIEGYMSFEELRLLQQGPLPNITELIRPYANNEEFRWWQYVEQLRMHLGIPPSLSDEYKEHCAALLTFQEP